MNNNNDKGYNDCPDDNESGPPSDFFEKPFKELPNELDPPDNHKSNEESQNKSQISHRLSKNGEGEDKEYTEDYSYNYPYYHWRFSFKHVECTREKPVKY